MMPCCPASNTCKSGHPVMLRVFAVMDTYEVLKTREQGNMISHWVNSGAADVLTRWGASQLSYINKSTWTLLQPEPCYKYTLKVCIPIHLCMFSGCPSTEINKSLNICFWYQLLALYSAGRKWWLMSIYYIAVYDICSRKKCLPENLCIDLLLLSRLQKVILPFSDYREREIPLRLWGAHFVVGHCCLSSSGQGGGM